MTSELKSATPSLKPIWTRRQIRAATFFGGPLAGAFLMSKNFKIFEDPAAAKKTLKWAALLTTLYLLAIGFIPAPLLDKIPRFVFPIITTGVLEVFVERLQKSQIEVYLKLGKRNSHWKVFGLIFPFLALTFVWGVGMAFIADLITSL